MKNSRLAFGVKSGAAIACALLGLIGAVAISRSRARRRKRQICVLTSLVQQQEEELQKIETMLAQLGKQVASEGRQRAEERKGRTEAERRLRERKQEMEQTIGYNLTAIGTISTPFRDRRGTPRQGSITPLSRGKVTLDATIVGYPALIGLSDFSHVWLLFVFHDNTNATVNGVVGGRVPAPKAGLEEKDARNVVANVDGDSAGGTADEPGRWGGGAREFQPAGFKLRQTFLTKVCPPRLGKKIGVLGTRSPHRPNPLGLTMVKLETVDLKSNSLTVSGVDLVDGTPILDVKPVIPHDVPHGMRVPEWVKDDPCVRRVVFTDAACEGLGRRVGEMARKSKSKFYDDTESFKAAVSEILVQDVRSVHQGRGLASDELYECCFDGVVMFFVTTENEIRVVSVE